MLGCAGVFVSVGGVEGWGFFGVGNCVILVGSVWDGEGGYGLYLWKSFRMVSKIWLLGIVCSSFRWLFTDASL